MASCCEECEPTQLPQGTCSGIADWVPQLVPSPKLVKVEALADARRYMLYATVLHGLSVVATPLLDE